MATTPVTLEDIAKSLDPDGKVANPADIVSQANPILRDAPLLESNLPQGHRETIITEVPEAYWYKYGKGTIATKGKKQQVTDEIGMLISRSQVDYEMAKINNMSASWRMNEDKVHIEGNGQSMAKNLFYGDVNNNDDGFNGFTQRYNSLSGNMAGQVINAGGTTANDTNLTSIWLVCWDTNTVNLRYPKGQPQSSIIETMDRGIQTVTDSDNGGRYEVLETVYKSKIGLSIKDYRYVVRICNIPVTSIAASATNYDLWNLLIQAMHRVPMEKGQMRFYMNRDVNTLLDLQAFNKSNIQLNPVELANGEKPLGFRNIPFRVSDGLLNTEDQVTA